MNENPEGTPNPLNPNPAPAPTVPVPEPTPTPEPVAPQPEPVATPATTPVAQPARPTPVAEPAAPEAKKKMKPGIIVGIVLIAVAVICGIAAAVVMLVRGNGDDRVNQAVTKVLNGEIPNNISANGLISVYFNDEDSAVTALNVDYRGVVDTTSSSQASSATITATMRDEREMVFEFNETQLKDGDLYLRIARKAENAPETPEEAPEALEGGLEETPELDAEELDAPVDETNCLVDEEGVTNCVLPQEEQDYGILFNILEVIDGEWIRIPMSAEETEEGAISADELLDSNSLVCTVKALSKMSSYGNSIATYYKQNPFITYTTDNLKISQEANPLYRLSVDSVSLQAFEKAINSSAVAEELVACIGEDTIGANDGSASLGIFAGEPAVYVEINDDYNFTRFYLSGTSADGQYSITADLALSYPAVLTITEPDEYVDASEVLMMIISQLYMATPEGISE